MRTPFLRSYGRPVVWSTVLLLILVVAPAHAGSAAPVSGVVWSALTLQAMRFGSTATAEITLDTLPAAAAASDFLESPQGIPLAASGKEIARLTVSVELDILGERQVRLENRLWLDPPTHTPLYLVRTRFGLKDYYQRFRFTREGVFRQQVEPASAREAARPPEAWSRTGRNFYPYPAERPGCSGTIETSMLINLIAALPVTAGKTPPSFCVFHKRQLHWVSLHAQPERRVRFDYLEKRGEQEMRRTGSVSASGVSLVSRPIGSYRGDVEDFIENDSQLILSPEERLPLVVSGELPLIGRVEMRLKAVRFR